MNDFLPYAVAVTLVWKLVDLAKYLRAKDTNAALTQAAVWVSGIVVALLLRESDFSSSVHVGDFVLANLNLASTVLFGVALGSTASVAVDTKKAIDGSDSAVTPKLFPKDGGTNG